MFELVKPMEAGQPWEGSSRSVTNALVRYDRQAALLWGRGALTYARASKQIVGDARGNLRTLQADEMPQEGMEFISENLLKYSEDLSQSAWVKNGTASVTGTDTINFPAVNDSVHQTITAPLGARMSCAIDLSGEGTTTFMVYSSKNGILGTLPITLTAQPARYVLSTVAVSYNEPISFILKRNDGATPQTATQITAAKAQVNIGAKLLPYVKTTSVPRTLFSEFGSTQDCPGLFGVTINKDTKNKGEWWSLIPDDAVQGNVCTNGTFATDLSGWATYGSRAASREWSSVNGGSMRIVRQLATGHEGALWNCTAGKKYRVAFKIMRPTGSDATASLTNNADQQAITPAAYDTWENKSFDVFPNSSGQMAFFNSASAVGADFYIDDVTIQEIKYAVGTKTLYAGSWKNNLTGRSFATGDTMATAEIIDDTAQLTADNLITLQPNGKAVEYATGAAAATLYYTGPSGNTSKHSGLVFARLLPGSSFCPMYIEGTGIAVSVDKEFYREYRLTDFTPNSSTCRLVMTIPAYSKVRVIGEGFFELKEPPRNPVLAQGVVGGTTQAKVTKCGIPSQGNVQQDFHAVLTVTPDRNGVDYIDNDMRLFCSVDSRGVSNEIRTYGNNSFNFNAYGFWIIRSEFSKDVSAIWEFIAYQESANVIRAKIFKDGVEKYNSTSSGTLDHSNQSFDVGLSRSLGYTFPGRICNVLLLDTSVGTAWQDSVIKPGQVNTFPYVSDDQIKVKWSLMGSLTPEKYDTTGGVVEFARAGNVVWQDQDGNYWQGYTDEPVFGGGRLVLRNQAAKSHELNDSTANFARQYGRKTLSLSSETCLTTGLPFWRLIATSETGDHYQQDAIGTLYQKRNLLFAVTLKYVNHQYFRVGFSEAYCAIDLLNGVVTRQEKGWGKIIPLGNGQYRVIFFARGADLTTLSVTVYAGIQFAANSQGQQLSSCEGAECLIDGWCWMFDVVESAALALTTEHITTSSSNLYPRNLFSRQQTSGTLRSTIKGLVSLPGQVNKCELPGLVPDDSYVTVLDEQFTAWTGDNPDNWSLTFTEDADHYVTQSPTGSMTLISNVASFSTRIQRLVTNPGKRVRLTATGVVVNSGSPAGMRVGENQNFMLSNGTNQTEMIAQTTGFANISNGLLVGSTTIDSFKVEEVRYAIGTLATYSAQNITGLLVPNQANAFAEIKDFSYSVGRSKLRHLAQNGKGYRANNQAGASPATFSITGGVGVTGANTASAEIWYKGGGTGSQVQLTGGLGATALPFTNVWTRIQLESLSPTAITDLLQIVVAAGQYVDILLPGLYQSRYVPPYPIPSDGTAGGTSWAGASANGVPAQGNMAASFKVKMVVMPLKNGADMGFGDPRFFSFSVSGTDVTTFLGASYAFQVSPGFRFLVLPADLVRDVQASWEFSAAQEGGNIRAIIKKDGVEKYNALHAGTLLAPTSTIDFGRYGSYVFPATIIHAEVR